VISVDAAVSSGSCAAVTGVFNVCSCMSGNKLQMWLYFHIWSLFWCCWLQTHKFYCIKHSFIVCCLCSFQVGVLTYSMRGADSADRSQYYTILRTVFIYLSKWSYTDSSLLACDTVMGCVASDIWVGYSAIEMCASVHLITMSHCRRLESSSLIALYLKSNLTW
jgi:hypothetical protein